MFGRRKQDSQVIDAPLVEKAGGKNRPTPKRREREALNRRPLVPGDRRAAAKAYREQMRAERLKAREAMMTGDERHLPPRDKGPVRRFVRDFVDARFNAGEVFLIVAMVVVLLTFVMDPTVQLVATALLWATVIFSVVDGFVLSRRLKRALNAKFGAENVPAGSVRYGVLRAFQIRRTRLPKPMVKRGEYPH
ncbi:MAG: DUF3043 domain-containing protein [Actinomycetes bacterium]